ncbi:MAG: divalent-cation tolerance protein CutA [Candidatus Acidiferrum sp.]
MKAGGRSLVVLVTCGTLSESRKIARRVVQKRLAACVNVLRSPMNSYYIWKGKLEVAREYLLVMKTTRNRLAELEKEVKRLHSYEVPEFITLPVAAGTKDYLAWLESSVR